MTTDLWMLLYSAVLCLVIPLPGVAALLAMPGGPVWGFGNRDTSFPVPPWIERTRRAHTNMVENLGPFAALVLIAHVTGKANASTALGAEIFLAARVVYTGVYTAGIPILRTLVFLTSVTGEFLILWQILS